MKRFRSLALLLALAPGLGASSSTAPQPGDYRLRAPFVEFNPTFYYCEERVPDCSYHRLLAAVWVGDMNGDGRDDVVTAPDDNVFWILVQKADGTLETTDYREFRFAAENYTVSKAVALGDFNEDGALDLVSNEADDDFLGMVLLMSDGKGGHALEFRDMAGLLEFRRVFARDVDRDGHLDIVLLGRVEQHDAPGLAAVVAYGDGTGAFPRQATTFFPGASVVEMQMADFDGDGHDDLAFQAVVGFPGDNYLAISYHDGNDGFGPLVYTDQLFYYGAAIGDFDGDEAAEITDFEDVPIAVSIAGDRQTRRERMAPIANLYPFRFLVSDLDLDGRVDLYSEEYLPGTVRFATIHLQLAQGWIHAQGNPFDGPFLPDGSSDHLDGYASGDVNGDGCPDVVTANAQSGLAFHLGSHCLPAARAARDDFDGDGHSDILWRHAGDGSNNIWLSGRSGLRQRVRAVRNTEWTVVATGDFDGDGKSDVFWRNLRTGANAIWPAAAPARMPVRGVTGLDWEVVGSGDFDDDGRDDVFWRNGRTGANAIWPGGHPGDVPVTAVRNVAWKVLAIGDFDGDRLDDLFWRNDETGDTVVWRGADNDEQMPTATLAGTWWQLAGVGDFDGDRRDDLLWRNANNGANWLWPGAARPEEGEVGGYVPGMPVGWDVAATGDYTGDGRADILWRNRQTGTNLIWRGTDANSRRPTGRVSDQQWRVMPTN